MLKSGIIGGNVIGVTATARMFLPISGGGMWRLLERIKAGGDRVSDICGALPSANSGESGPVGQSHGSKSAKLNPLDSAHSSDGSISIYFCFWVELAHTLKWQV